jgi:hypothetical protein
MKDRLWQAVYNALRPLLNNADVVAVPKGDWPAFPCAAILYDDLIELKDCTILVLRKGQLTSLPKAELRRIAEQWQWIFANEVFVVLSRSDRVKKDIRRGPDCVHCRPLTRFLSSAALRKRQSRIEDRIRSRAEDGRYVDVGVTDAGVPVACLLSEPSRLSEPSASARRL